MEGMFTLILLGVFSLCKIVLIYSTLNHCAIVSCHPKPEHELGTNGCTYVDLQQYKAPLAAGYL
jgi:hypothetical protein